MSRWFDIISFVTPCFLRRILNIFETHHYERDMWNWPFWHVEEANAQTSLWSLVIEFLLTNSESLDKAARIYWPIQIFAVPMWYNGHCLMYTTVYIHLAHLSVIYVIIDVITPLHRVANRSPKSADILFIVVWSLIGVILWDWSHTFQPKDIISYKTASMPSKHSCQPAHPHNLLSIFAITKTRLFKYIENFTTKNWNFSDKNSDIFHISLKT